MITATTATNIDWQSIGVGGIFAILVLNIVFSFLKPLILGNKELDSKNLSRDRIAETAGGIQRIESDIREKEDAFFSMKTKVDSMEKIIGRRNQKDVPLIYNPSLEAAIDNLADNVEKQAENTGMQTEAIRGLIDNCKKRG